MEWEPDCRHNLPPPPPLGKLQGTTYRAPLTVDLVCQIEGVATQQRLSRRLGQIPIMVKSKACYLRHMKRGELVRAKEEGLEFGGYFICNGIERIIRMLIQVRSRATGGSGRACGWC